MRKLPADTQLRACVITLGEVEAGHLMTKSRNQKRRDEYTAFINEKFLPHAIEVSVTTRLYYAEIMGGIWKRHPPLNNKVKTEAHLLKWGVDVNDVWLASVAWEHNLILVTRDVMTVIKEAAPDIQTESWL